MAEIAQWTASYADGVGAAVTTALNVSLQRAYEAYDKAVETIGELGEVDFDLPADIHLQSPMWTSGSRPAARALDTLPALSSLPDINDPGVTLGDPGQPPEAGSVPTYTEPTIQFSDPVAPPTPTGIVAPIKPVIDYNLAVPPEPTLAYPGMGPITQISIPAFTAPVILGFSDIAPTFNASMPNTIMGWSEDPYEQDILPEVRDVLERLMEGAAIPPAVEDAMWQRARAREDVVAQKAVGDAFNDWAGKGFTMPPGMLVEQVNSARFDAMLKTNTLSRDVAIKHAEWMQENVRFSVVQGIAYETLLVNIWEGIAKRAFEMQKLSSELGVKLYEVQVAIFNATMQAYKIKADVWKTQIEAAMTEVQIYKARIDAEVAKGSINEQYVRMYVAQMDAVKTRAEIYKTTVSAVQVKADLMKLKVSIFGEEVQAYQAQLNAQKLPIEIYDLQVRVEANKASLLEARVKEFAARIQAFDTLEQSKMRTYTAQIQAMGLRVDTYKAKLSVEQMKLDAAVSKNEQVIKQYLARVDKYKADSQLDTEYLRVNYQVFADRVRANLTFADAQVKQWAAKSELLLKKADLQSRALQAAAQNSTGLSSATMSAVHYSTGYSASAGLSASESRSGDAA